MRILAFHHIGRRHPLSGGPSRGRRTPQQLQARPTRRRVSLGAAIGALLLLLGLLPSASAATLDVIDAAPSQFVCAGTEFGVPQDVDADGTFDTLVLFAQVAGSGAIARVGDTGEQLYFFGPLSNDACTVPNPTRGQVRFRFVDMLAPGFSAANPATWVFKRVPNLRVEGFSNGGMTIQAFRQLNQTGPIVGTPTFALILDFADPTGIMELVATTDRQGSVLANLFLLPPAIQTDVASVSVPEGGGRLFRVKLSGPPAAPTTVSVVHETGDPDLTVRSGASLSFTRDNWSTFQTVTLVAAPDTDPNNGTAIFRCEGFGLTSARVTATEADTQVAVSINDISVRATSVGTRTASFTVSLNHTLPTDTSVRFATADDSATGRTITSPGDYLATSGTLTIPAFATSSTILVTVVGDVDPISERFFVNLSAPSRNAVITDPQGQCTILPAFIISTGEFDLRTGSDRVRVGESAGYSLTWTVPEGEVWRNLRSLDLRLRVGNKIPLWVKWDEAANTLRLCESAGPAFDPDCTEALTPGSPSILEAGFARLDVSQSAVVGSGPTGRTVTLNLPITFAERAPGHYRVELAAADDFGTEDNFLPAGELQVLGPEED